MSDNVTHDDGMVSMPEEKHDALKASLSDAKEKADRVDDLEAALSEAEDERDDLQTQVEAMNPLVDTLQAALSDQTGLSDDFVGDMSPAEIQDAYAGDLSDLLDDTAGDDDVTDDGGAGGAVGSSGDGVSQTGATGGSSALSDDEQEQVAALEARAEHAENMDGDHWDAAAEVARDKIDAIKGDN